MNGHDVAESKTMERANRREQWVMQLKAFIFDLDGVITDTAEYHYRAWQRLADEEGFPFDRTVNEQLRGISRRASLDIILAGRSLPEDQILGLMARKNQYYVDMLDQVSPADLLPGAVELLHEARAAGIRTALGSASRNAWTVIERLGIADLFDAISDGASVERTKPAPDLFLHAAAQLGVPPADCAVFEDAEAGILAAQAAGMRTVGLGPPARVGMADVVFPSLADVRLADLLMSLSNRLNALTADFGELSRAAPRAPDLWVVEESGFAPAHFSWQETVFTIGNGYVGVRGAFEEGYPGDKPVTLVHGLFDKAPLVFTELVNIPNWLDLHLVINGETFRLDHGEILSYRRTLDLRNGVLVRQVRWRSPGGYTTDLAFERFASLDNPHLLVLRCQATPVDFSGLVEIHAGLNGHVENESYLHWHVVSQDNPDPQTAVLEVRTRGESTNLGMAGYLRAAAPGAVTYRSRDCAGQPGSSVQVYLEPGQTILAEKLVAVFTSRDGADPSLAAQSLLREVTTASYADLLVKQTVAWSRYWDVCDIVVEGDADAQTDQLALRYNIFQLLITGSPTDERVSIPAKMLSGFGYRGHVFWDTEIFILPFFTLTQPAIARNLLMYRYHTLAGARRKATEAGFEGAMVAWESASTGDEVTPRWLPGPNNLEMIRIWCGDIELHITADVAYAVWQYWLATGDEAFFADYGAEIILDTARFWGSRAAWNEAHQRYEINDVIGPDEYHDHVDNSAFTNRMARWNLETALNTLAWLRAHQPAAAARLTASLDLTAERLARWQDVIARLYLQPETPSGLIEQFDGFFNLTDVDLAAYEPRAQSMQALLGIEGANHHQVLKQADVIMLLTLLNDEYDAATKRANWDYYVPRTDHTYGSSLGPAIHAIMACELGQPDLAYEHFRRAALVDLHDVRGNAADGVHGASAGGLWQAAVMGFGGLRLHGENWTTQPRLPRHWRRLQFKFVYRGRVESVEIQAPAS